jgi:hypothetical protein
VMNEHLAEQFLRDDQRRPLVERSWKDAGAASRDDAGAASRTPAYVLRRRT